jgi:hypothetical protein
MANTKLFSPTVGFILATRILLSFYVLLRPRQRFEAAIVLTTARVIFSRLRDPVFIFVVQEFMYCQMVLVSLLRAQAAIA